MLDATNYNTDLALTSILTAACRYNKMDLISWSKNTSLMAIDSQSKIYLKENKFILCF